MTMSEPASSGGWESPALPLTWSAEVSPANPSRSLAAAERRTTSGGSGLRRGPSFATYDLRGRCWRTYRVYLSGEWETYSETWPRSGMTRSGTAYPLAPSAPRTSATGYSSSPHQAEFPTPSATAYGSSGNGSGNNTTSRGRPSLETMAARAMWPTPRAQDAKHSTPTDYELNRDAAKDLLHVRVARVWPTPRATDGSHGGRVTPRKGREGGNLIEAVSARTIWPTPTARDAGRGAGWDEPGRPLSERVGGALNPTWVEWLMGFPPGWTDLGPSATPSSRRSPSTSAGS